MFALIVPPQQTTQRETLRAEQERPRYQAGERGRVPEAESATQANASLKDVAKITSIKPAQREARLSHQLW